MKVTVVKAARKSPGKCSKCGDVIKEGQTYRHWAFRFGGKRVRCAKSECYPKQSDLTSNEQLSALYAANEGAEEDLADWKSDEIGDLEAIRDNLASQVEEVASGYREKADNIESGFGHSTSVSDELTEKADEVDSYQQEIEGVSFEEFEFDAESEASEEEQRETWREEQRELLSEAMSTCSL
jgi:hypothetical protein